ncbi:hypothetical protein PENTCL1PPCAC_14267, partial [Pristionchus entomophagus]
QICRDLIFFVAGPPSKTFNYVSLNFFRDLFQSRAPVYLTNFLVSTSTWNLLQWAQHSLQNGVSHFDATPSENMRRYGQLTPPAYNYSNIDTDIYLFWSRNDWVTAPQEIERWLMRQMRPLVIKGTFEIPEYNHLDFAVATDVADRVINRIIEIVRRNETNACTE